MRFFFVPNDLALQRLCLCFYFTVIPPVHAKLLFVAAYLFCNALPFTRALWHVQNHQVIAQHVLLQNKTTYVVCVRDSILCRCCSNSTRFQKVLVLTMPCPWEKVEVHGSGDHPWRRLFRPFLEEWCSISVPISSLIEVGFFGVWGLPMSFHNNIKYLQRRFDSSWDDIKFWSVWIHYIISIIVVYIGFPEALQLMFGLWVWWKSQLFGQSFGPGWWSGSNVFCFTHLETNMSSGSYSFIYVYSFVFWLSGHFCASLWHFAICCQDWVRS